LIRPPGDVAIGPGNAEWVPIRRGNCPQVEIQQFERYLQPSACGEERLYVDGAVESQQGELTAQHIIQRPPIREPKVRGRQPGTVDGE